MRLVLVVLFLQRFAAESEVQCEIWLAPSTIPGAGLGIFTGRSFSAGQLVTPGDVSVPLIDMEVHNRRHWELLQMKNLEFPFVWDEYTWSADAFVGMEQEVPGIDSAQRVKVIEEYPVYGASFGIGALPNCYFGFNGVKESYTQLDTANVTRSLPGAGAFSPYYDRQGRASRPLQAFEEIFVDYGTTYFLGSREDTIGLIPFEEDYDVADHLIRRLLRIRTMMQRRTISKTDSILTDLFHLLTENVTRILPSRALNAVARINNYTSSSLFPHLGEMLRRGGVLYTFNPVRSSEWMKENNAVCLSHTEIKTSLQLPGAGRGVFVRAPVIRKGEIVTALPLLHIPDRAILNMYYGQDEEIGPNQQLLLNYCFGHNETSLLLCPYGIASSAINHASTSTGIEPNVRLEWNTELSSHMEWLDQPLADWANSFRAGLVWNVVAERDIVAGDELFLDYGRAWEASWLDHLSQWKPPRDAYASASQLNERLIDDDFFQFQEVSEQDAVELRCRDAYRLISGLHEMEVEQESHRCRVILTSQGTFYAAELVEQLSYKYAEQCYEHVSEVLWHVPRDAFYFHDKPYSRDHAQPWAFRHALGIPEHLLPAVWRNTKRE